MPDGWAAELTLRVRKQMYAGDFMLQSHSGSLLKAPPPAATLALARALRNCPCNPGPPPAALFCQHRLHCYQALSLFLKNMFRLQESGHTCYDTSYDRLELVMAA